MALKKYIPQTTPDNGVGGEYIRIDMAVPPMYQRDIGWSNGSLRFSVYRDQAARDAGLVPVKHLSFDLPKEVFFGMTVMEDNDATLEMLYGLKSMLPGLENAEDVL